MTDPAFVAETLAWCNSIRDQKGLAPLDRLPLGNRSDPWSCPCGEATGLYVDRITYGHDIVTWGDNPLPAAVVRFVAAFDGGQLPQYDESPRQAA